MTPCIFISVDFQRDFVDPDGKSPCSGSSPVFITKSLIPWMEENDIEVLEIISDYRLPRGKSKNESCVPGTKGYESLIPAKIKNPDVFIKCMHNPTWMRDNIGDPTQAPSDVYPLPERFTGWVEKHIPSRKKPIVLFGETMECCILNVSQELYFRGYNVFVLYEASDPMSINQAFKDIIAYNSSLSIYAQTMRFDELKGFMGL